MKTNPAPTKRTNIIAAAAITLGTIVTIFLYLDNEDRSVVNSPLLICVLAGGSVMAWAFALRKKQTIIPEMVSLVYAIAGAGAMLIAVNEFQHIIDTGLSFPADTEEDLPGFVFVFGSFGHPDTFLMTLGTVMGAVSFAGSIITMGKFNGKIKPWNFKGQRTVNIILLVLLIGYVSFFVFNTPITTGNFGFALTATDGLQARAGLYDIHKVMFWITIPLALVCGVMFGMFITAQSMPIIISFLYATGGVAMAVVGFTRQNNSLMLAGILILFTCVLLTLFLSKSKSRPG